METEPVGLQAARTRWGGLVDSAASGATTWLRDAESGAAAGIAPLSALTVPAEELPARGVTQARPKLGDLVRAAAQGQATVLTRHGHPVAAIVPPADAPSPSGTGGLDDLLDAFTSAAPEAPSALAPTGLEGLDVLLGGGLRPGYLAAFSALPGAGSSSLALVAARAAALEAGRPVMVASAQMLRADVAARMLAAETGIPLQQITTRTVPVEDQPRMTQAADRFRTAPLQIFDRQTSLAHIRGTATRITGLALLVLDPVTHLESGTVPLPVALRRLAADLDTAVLAVAPAGTSAADIEAEADLAARLYRDNDSDTAHLEIVRHRHGPTAVLPLQADLARARLYPAADARVADPPSAAPPPRTAGAPASAPATQTPDPEAVPATDRAQAGAANQPSAAPPPRPTGTNASLGESPAAREARAGHARHQARRRTSSADHVREQLRETIATAVDQELAKAEGDADAATGALVKRAIPDVMALFARTRAGARYEYTAYPALPDILRKPSKTDPDLVWEARPSWRNPGYRRHPDGELAVTALDVNAAYLSALKVWLPIGKLEHHTGGEHDRKRSGVYLITPPAWTHPHLPSPLGDREEEGPLWVTDATLRLLLRLSGPKHGLMGAPRIHESWTSSATETFLDSLRQLLAAVRTDALDQGDDVTASYVKAMYSKFVSTLGESSHNRELVRPDWMHLIRSQAFSNLWGRAYKAHQAGLTVISALGTDELHLAGGDWRKVWDEGRGLAEMKVKTDRDGNLVHYTATPTTADWGH